MNKALNLTNWRHGGKYYIKKATSANKWVGFQQSVIENLKTEFGDEFFIVIWTDESKENDFFNIPFAKLKHVFTEEHKTTGKYPDRWTAVIRDNSFLMHSSSQLAIDISDDYGNLHDADENNGPSTVEDDLTIFELENEYFEGEKKNRLSNFYERNPKLRKAAIRTHGTICKVCKFDFKEFYGALGSEFIEVHHLIPVSKLEVSTKLSPNKDMTVVCSNCHRMLHRSKDRVLTPDELIVLISQRH